MELYLLLLYLFIVGASIGSFLNVVGLRIPMGESLMGRSHCPHCQRKLSPLDLIPLFSYIFLRAKCRYCSRPISPLYFFIELTTGIIFALFSYKAGFVININSAIIFLILLSVIALTVSDISYQVILDEFLVIVFLAALILHSQTLLAYLPGALLGAGAFWLIHAISRGTAMGFADVKYVFLMGLLLPLPLLLLALYLAFLTGGLVSVILILRQKKGLKSTIAFGPFLSVGLIIALWLIN